MSERSGSQAPKSSIAEVLAGLRETSVWQERVYKDIHAHPELSFQETKTASLVASKLKEFGYEVLEGVGRTGVVGILRNGEGQTVLARADAGAAVSANCGVERTDAAGFYMGAPRRQCA
jgi:hippurate hydrolase